MRNRNYTDLCQLETFEERFEYLKLSGEVGADTFGFDRYLNQRFYHSLEWKRLRRYVIIRDNGCDLGIQDRNIGPRIIIHHMNPINVKDIEEATEFLMNPEYLICVSHNTHNSIHYGNSDNLLNLPVERTPYDTVPWKR